MIGIILIQTLSFRVEWAIEAQNNDTCDLDAIHHMIESCGEYEVILRFDQDIVYRNKWKMEDELPY